MQIKLIAIGKTDSSELERLISVYQNRLAHYVRFSFEVIPDLKNTKSFSEKLQKEEEGKLILSKIMPTDRLILLDENGK